MYQTAFGRHGDRTRTADSGARTNLARYPCAVRPAIWIVKWFYVLLELKLIFQIFQIEKWFHVFLELKLIQKLFFLNWYKIDFKVAIDSIFYWNILQGDWPASHAASRRGCFLPWGVRGPGIPGRWALPCCRQPRLPWSGAPGRRGLGDNIYMTIILWEL